MARSKILIVHPLASKLDSVLKKINTIIENGESFDTVFYVGDVLTKDTDINTKPIVPSYYLQGKQELTDEVKKKVSDLRPLDTVVGNFVGIQELDGVSIGYIPGHNLDKLTSELVNEVFSDKKLDILLTYYWPEQIASEVVVGVEGKAIIDEVVKKTQPKYIFACGQRDFEMDAFQWSETFRTTRFISLGPYKSKTKWFYGFNIVNDEATETELDNEKVSRNVYERKRKSTEEDNANAEGTTEKKKQKVVNPENCFFCLSNPKVELHMVISVGQYSYMTIAKGPLTKPNKFKNKPISGHVLLIPINHIGNVILSGDKDEYHTNCSNEMIKYEESLKSFFKDTFQMGTCSFEICTKKNVHFHQQVMPFNTHISVSKFYNFLKSFQERNNSREGRTVLDFKMFEETKQFDKFRADHEEIIGIQLHVYDIDQNKQDEVLPFMVEENRLKTYYFVSKVDSSETIDLQFPRRVIASFLKLKDRIYWNKCVQSKEMETFETETFRELFKNYDLNQ